MNEWIKVEDQLPEKGVSVLTLDYSRPDYPEYKIDYIVNFEPDNFYVWACRLVDEWDKVTHWMPLPRLPEYEK